MNDSIMSKPKGPCPHVAGVLEPHVLRDSGVLVHHDLWRADDEGEPDDPRGDERHDTYDEVADAGLDAEPCALVRTGEEAGTAQHEAAEEPGRGREKVGS